MSEEKKTIEQRMAEGFTIDEMIIQDLNSEHQALQQKYTTLEKEHADLQASHQKLREVFDIATEHISAYGFPETAIQLRKRAGLS